MARPESVSNAHLSLSPAKSLTTYTLKFMRCQRLLIMQRTSMINILIRFMEIVYIITAAFNHNNNQSGLHVTKQKCFLCQPGARWVINKEYTALY